MQLKPNTRLQNGKYEILRTLGQGGFGITYEAEHVLLRSKVAIKEFFMKDCCERDESTSAVTVGTGSQRKLVEKFRRKFIREAQMIHAMSHPGIVKVTDVFEENGTAYYVMENLTGGSLAKWVRENGPLSEVQAEKYIRQVAAALEYIHSQNTVHLDVKPSNILLNAKGDAVLIDFGISKHYDDAGEQTSSTPVGISKGYAPLEQSRDGDVSQFKPSTDIYALGATLYFLLFGETPPEASVAAEDGLPRPQDVSDRMWQAITQAMQPFRKNRPQSVAAFLALLDARPAVSAAPKVAAADSEATVMASVAASKSQNAPKPEDTPKPNAVPKEFPKPAEPKKSKLWLWALLCGISAAAVIAVVVLGGRKDKPISDGRLTASNTATVVSPAADSVTPAPPSTPVKLETKPKPTARPAVPGSNAKTGLISGHEWMDLGLSVKWATCNVGASSPSDYGSYFAWGEITTKSEYTWENYRFRMTGDSRINVTFNKYNTDSSRGNVDNKKRLDMSDDSARQNWGGSWRMPTDVEWAELREQCEWTWTTLDDISGYMVTSKTNGNSIFFPAAGRRYARSIHQDYAGFYWSSSLYSVRPCYTMTVAITSTSVDVSGGGERCFGCMVRPVTE